MGGSASDFFSFIDQQNNAIAAREARKVTPVEFGGLDQARLRREEERRERLGQLRAREHSSKRPHRARPAFGHVNPS